MEVIFVRHGQTQGNLARRHQAPDTPLTTEGERQAVAVAAEVAPLAPTHLIASAHLRAVETARFIAAETGLEITVDERFVELQRPSNLYGHFRSNWHSVWFYTRWYLGFTRPDSTFENGESYQEFRERLCEARAVLATYPPDARVVVVSHAVFIVFFVAHLKRASALGPLAALRTFRRILTIENASVTKVVV